MHRTFLRPDGSGKADLEPVRMMLGPVAGGAVRLQAATEILALAEGIETAWSVQLGTGYPTWAALSAGNLAAVTLPALPLARTIVICADADRAGVCAAQAAAARWHGQGRVVRIAQPRQGLDFNDLLRGGV